MYARPGEFMPRRRKVVEGWGYAPEQGGGVPALAWRYPDTTPVLRAGGGYWLKAS